MLFLYYKKINIFILTTNELDDDKLPIDELLKNYKAQQKVERGFSFFKEPGVSNLCGVS